MSFSALAARAVQPDAGQSATDPDSSGLRTVDLAIVATSDVHGNFFPYNFITRKPWTGSLARVSTYVDSLRTAMGSSGVVLLDNGDILQGQPTVYYYNFIDTVSPHIAADIYRYMGYDAATIGNHDVETGHAVYDRWIAQSEQSLPVLGANVVDAATGEPYLKPYTVIERDGARIAVLGLITPAVPAWLPRNLWEGLRFEDMEQSAEKWIEILRQREDPDVIIGLFHSGADGSHNTAGYVENASVEVARKVDGFDAVLFGHDHRRHASTLLNDAGHAVVTLNPANNARGVARLDLRLTFDGEGNLTDKKVSGRIDDVEHTEPSQRFMEHFAPQIAQVNEFVGRRIGRSTGSFDTRDAFFGPSAFIDLIHRLQLAITGADVSFAAPLSFDAAIAEGDVTMADMFNLYKYENLLYTIRMTGDEIRRYLEKSYDGWIRTMSGPGEHMLRFSSDNPEADGAELATPAYNFDSAAGVRYTVDLTRPAGERVTVTAMADGSPFDPDRVYTVAVNSYRAGGGGDLMTVGAGITADELPSRMVSSTEKDLRYYLMEQISKEGTITPEAGDNWRFIPEEYQREASARDRRLLFNDN